MHTGSRCGLGKGVLVMCILRGSLSSEMRLLCGTGNGNGNGYGNGNGDGNGYGYGNGDGNGYGDGNGNGYGYGDGNGDGYGYGYGYGDGYGNGYGYGNDDGNGNGNGNGDGDGNGNGYGDDSDSIIYWMQSLPMPDPAIDKAGAILAYWLSNADGTPANGGSGTKARVGLVEEISGPLKICTKNALHGTLKPPKWSGERVWIVALYPPFQFQEDKIASLRREFIASCNFSGGN